jgi:hypothetical protein
LTLLICVCADLADPDDGSCETYEDLSTCQRDKSVLSSDTSKCYWDNEHRSCHIRDIGGDFQRVVMVAVIVAVIGTPFALMAEALICNVLAADTIRPKAVSMDSTEHRDIYRKSLQGLRRPEEAMEISAEEEFRDLTRDIHAYRSSLLTLQERKDFDG